MSKKNPLEWDAIGGSELKDTQGEILSVEGADITELLAGRGRLNDNHGAGMFNSIGRITDAKKIFKREDCTDSRHEYYWDKIKAPYIYIRGVMYDDEDHPNAKAAAAILRNVHRNDNPLKLKCSVEGGVIARGVRDSTFLARTKIHSLAATFTPANQATLMEPLNLQKNTETWEADQILIKSVVHLAKSDVPSFRAITRNAQAEKIVDNFRKINELAKANGLTPIPEQTAERWITEALSSKISGNINKINELVKALTKTVPKPDAHAYNFGLDRPEGGKYEGYTGKDAKKAQLHALKTAMNNDVAEGNHVKMMEHLETGIREPHILLHHGINHETGDATGTASKRPKDAGNHNVFSVKDGVVDHPSFGVHTLYHSVADEYTNNNSDGEHYKSGLVGSHHIQYKEDGNQYVEDTPDSGVHSFWVPTSGIHSMRDYENSRFKNKQFPLPGKPGEYEREDLEWDPHSEDQKHVVIRPGKYRQASHDDIKELHEKSKKDEWSRSPFENNRRYFTKDGIIEGGKKLNKALTAGYGGAATPTNRGGGAVLQSESLDDGRVGFKYFTCPQCGHEQIYAKNQVKCRDCNKNMSLEQLYNIMTRSK